MSDMVSDLTIRPGGPIRREVRVPGDKSLSHRALMFSALAEGESTLRGLQAGLDVAATKSCFERLGVPMREEGGALVVTGRGLQGFDEPEDVLDCANSGTTMRLLAGIVAGQPFLSVLTGDRHLRKRPMARVLDPLREMGALALGRREDTLAPLTIRGGSLRGIEWVIPVASAQVKSAILLAGLNARGETWVEEPQPTRDHTERMFASMGVEVLRDGPRRVGVKGGARLRPVDMTVPGDPSSAAFWAAAAALVPGSKVTVRGISLNPTRTGFFRILERMGAKIDLAQRGEAMGEPVGDVTVEASELEGVRISPEEVPSAIDEFPILGVVASFARGETVVTGAEELRHKESDRIDAVAGELRKAGVEVTTFPDGMRIDGRGGKHLNATARFDSHGDHRLAMAMGVLGLLLPGGAVVADAGAAAVSYPGFFDDLLGKGA